MKIGIVLYAYLLPEPLDRILNHILTTTSAHVYLFLHSQDADVVRVCESYMSVFQWWPRIHYFPYGVNRGLARSVNEALHQGYVKDGCDVMMNGNDDLLPAEGDIERMAQAAMDHRDCWLIEGYGKTRQVLGTTDISLSVINPIALKTIGYFDENFFPAYFEDTDYVYRAKLAGLPRFMVRETYILHYGSASMHRVDAEAFTEAFRRIQSYYVRKWGGINNYELFQKPFNNPAFTLSIPFEERRTPYPGYDRTDYEELESCR